MTDRELKRLSRADLLELLLIQMKENEQLRRQLDDLQKKLDDRTLMIDNAGSIAEAVIEINGVFEAAQKAYEQYMMNMQILSDRQSLMRERMEQETRERCDRMLAEAKAECDRILTGAHCDGEAADE